MFPWWTLPRKILSELRNYPTPKTYETVLANYPRRSPAEIHFPEVNALLAKFADVFPEELPLGLPPARPTEHRIDLVEGARPPSHRIYRLCPAELAQLKKQLAEYLKASAEPVWGWRTFCKNERRNPPNVC